MLARTLASFVPPVKLARRHRGRESLDLGTSVVPSSSVALVIEPTVIPNLGASTMLAKPGDMTHKGNLIQM